MAMPSVFLQLQQLQSTREEQIAHLPVTKLPALHPSMACAEPGRHRREVALQSTEKDPIAILKGFARFVASLCGLGELSFEISGSGIVHALVNDDGSTELKLLGGIGLVETDFLIEVFDNAPPAGNKAKVEAQETAKDQRVFTVLLRQAPNNTSITLDCSATLIPPTAVEHLLSSLQSYLFPQLTPSTSLSILNFPPYELSSDKELLHTAFERRVAEHPHRPALDFLKALPHTHRVFTYLELDRVAEKVAVEIQNTPEMKGNIVPVYMSTSAELYISYFATLKAGFAFCPMPTDAPASRLVDILSDIDGCLVLGRGPLPSKALLQASKTLGKEVHWIDVHEVIQRLSSPPLTPITPASGIEPHAVAYVLYTSGSTGKPKGVQISHLAATNSITAHSRSFPLSTVPNKQSRWFQFAAPTFDPSIMEVFVTLSSGGTLCSAERELALTNIESVVTELRATIMMATPSLAAIMRPAEMPTLRSLWTMGESLLPKVIGGFASDSESRKININDQSENGPRGLINAYGPTEAAINCTLFKFPASYRGSIIGPPLPTCSLFILDPACKEPKPIALGLSGELAIGGPQVALGYLNRPEEIDKSFVVSRQFGRLYRTGDRARIVWTAAGDLLVEFLGRIVDEQVKLSGRRVELGDVDSAVSKAPGVSEIATVVYREGGTHGSEKLVACVVPNDQGFIQDACEGIIAELLPEYMRPWKYMFLPSLPRNSSGKLDRKTMQKIAGLALERHVLAHTPDDTSTAVSAGGAGVEYSKVDLLRSLLADAVSEDIAVVRANTNMLSLGLDSLRTILFLQKARSAGFEGLTVASVLKSKTPDSIASLLEGGGTNLGKELPQIVWQKQVARFHERHLEYCAERLGVFITDIEKILPTTATQTGMAISFLRAGSPNIYINHSVFRIAVNTDIELLQRCWDTVLARHDSFHMAFVAVDDNKSPFAQCILSSSCSQSKNAWNLHQVDSDSDFDRVIDDALRAAESAINPQKPPVIMSLVQSRTKSSIILTMFHGIFDGGSLHLLLEEVAGEYHGYTFYPRTPIYKAVEAHFTSDLSKSKGYWAKVMEQFSPEPFPRLTGLKASAIRQVTETAHIKSRLRFEILLERTKAIGASPLAALQAAWGLVLSTYSDTQSEDVAFGSVLSNRLDRDSEVCMGPTFTTVPTRINLISFDTSVSVLKYLSNANLEALEHLHSPLGSLKTETGKPPYHTLLAFQKFGAGSESSDIWSSVEYPPMESDFAVVVEVWPEVDGSLKLKATYKDEFLSADGAEIMLRQVDDILLHMLHHPNSVYSSLRSEVAPELRCTSNPKPQGVPGETLRLHAQFEDHVTKFPDDVSLIFRYALATDKRNIEWSYAELNERASRVASHLIAKFGALTDCVIPLCIEKSPELYIAVLGVLKAGGGWCPLDPDIPPSRKHDLITRTEAKLLIISDASCIPCGSVPAYVQLVNINDALSSTVDGPALHAVRDKARSSHLAYLVWTSGTTGAPKGVPIEHHSAVSSMAALQAAVPSDVEGDVRCIQFSACTFDVFVQDLFYTWGVGGAVVSSTRELMLSAVPKLVQVTGATHVHLTPAFAASVPRSSCAGLRVITMIGEKLTQNVADDWAQDMRAYNTYGPAEATVVSTIRRFSGVEDPVKSENVGFPLSTVSCHVMRNGRATMKGGVGELALGGPHLARGYLNDPAKTADKFFWHEGLQERIYMTGDIVRFLHDGSIEFVGRTDDQVKLGGIRVELSEISAAMFGCHPVEERIETMYLSRPDRPTKIVVSFVAASQLTPDRTPSAITSNAAAEVARAARAQAEATLPKYMHPGLIIVVSHIPQTSSAKIDRKALTAVYAALDADAWDLKLHPPRQTAAENLAPTERAVIEQIAALSGMDTEMITTDASLRTLGIDSIRAIALTTRLTRLGYVISVIDVLQTRTIRGLISLAVSAAATAATAAAGSSASVKTGAERLEKFNQRWHGPVASKLSSTDFVVVPPTPLQEALLSETIQNPSAYWSNHFYALNPRTDLKRLRNALVRVVEDTEALRAAFIPTAELNSASSHTFLQVIYGKHPRIEWNHVTASPDLLRDAAKTQAIEITQRFHDRTFKTPLWAVTIFDRGAIPPVVMLTLHHALHDAQSLEFIAADIQAAYLGYKTPPRSQLTDALRLTIAADDVDSEKIEAFWAKELTRFADPEAIAFPDLTGKKPGQSKEGHKMYLEHSITLPSVDTAIIRAAWGCTLADFLETSSIVIGETLSERIQDITLSDTIAPLITVAPVPLRADGTARKILEETRRLSHDAWKNRHVLPTVVRKLLQRPQTQALYPAMFVFHPDNSDGLEREVVSVIWTPLEDIVGLTVEHSLALNVYAMGDGLLKLEFAAENTLMGMPQLELLARQVEALVNAMVTHPEAPVSELTSKFPANVLSIWRPVVSEAVRTAREVDPMFWVEHYALHHPEWMAVEVADSITANGATARSWDYSVLNAEANRIANLIDSCSIGRNRMVALCLPRTLEAYAPIAGVFKAGCGYLSIDEGLPAERKGLLVEDSNAGILFTTHELVKTFPALQESVKVICIDDPIFIGALRGYSGNNKVRDIHQDDISYLLYTSGSTGKPKGVQVSRGNLSAFVEAQSGFICGEVPATRTLGGKGKYLGLASRAFDVHVAEMFLAWRHGLAAVTALRSMLLDDIGLALAKLKVTHASFVPSLLDQADLVPADVPDLRFMGVGGEKISQRVIDTWAASKTVSLVNAYGPTEVTIGCSSLRVTPECTVRNIGNLVGNLAGYVFVPGTFVPTKRGQPGELCISGDLVALGYYQRPNAAGFVDYEGAHLYRTGDMVRLMPGDVIEYLGRSDDQAKIRGQRLELGEVSEGIRASAKEELDVATLILQHPGLSRSQLICFVARSSERFKYSGSKLEFLANDYRVFALDLQTGCRQKLPAYMVPDIVIPINIMPLAPMSGKADAKLLKALFDSIPLSDLLRGAGPTQQAGATRDLSDDEVAIRDIITKIVKVESKEVNHVSNIFELGIDSLSAITLSLKMKSIGYNSSVVSVLGNPTIEQLASLPRIGTDKAIERALADARKSLKDLDSRLKPQVAAIVGTPESSIIAVKPCIPLQEGIIARSINSESGPIYVNHVILKLNAGIDVKKLRSAWKDTVSSNEILRTCFCQPANEFTQVILASTAEPWKEASSASVDSALAEFNLQKNDVASTIISELQRQPPIRLQFVSTMDGGLLLYISMHHSIYDGESFTMLLDEVASRYQSSTVPERVPFDSFVEHLASQNAEKAKAFWRSSLNGCRPTLVATQTGYREDGGEAVMLAEHLISHPLTALENNASRLRCTLPSLAQLVFGILLAQRVGHNDVIFGSVLSGRSATVAGADTILAPLITTVPQRVQLSSGASTIVELAEEYQKANVALLEHQHTSLRQIQRWVGADRPLFDTLFSFTRKVEEPGANLWLEVESSTIADYPFAIEFEADVEADLLVARALFTPSYGTANEVKLVLEKIDLLLQDISGGGNVKLGDLGVSDLNADAQTAIAEVYDDASWTAGECSMRALVGEICKLPEEQITKSATFYGLGIDSVTAIRFARHLREMGIDISSADVIRYPSIGTLSQHIGQKATGIEALAQPIDIKQILRQNNIVMDPGSVEAVYSCTPLQGGMLTQTLASDGRLYVHHHCVKLNFETDLSRVRSAWLQVVAQTDILRTSFYHAPSSDNPWTAVVCRASSVTCVEEEISVAFEEALDAMSTGIAFTNEVQFQETPARARILKASTESYLVVSMHHSLYDGVSIPFVFHDLATAYSKSIIPPRRPFSDAATFISQSQEAAAEYWLRRISDYSALHLPRLPDDKSSTTVHLASCNLDLPTDKILARCKALDVTLQSVLLLAWGKIVSVLVGRRDVIFGQVVSGRTLPLEGVEGISGPLFNTIPMRVQILHDLQTNQSLVSQIQRNASNSQSHQHASLRTIQTKWRSASRSPAGALFDTLFVLQKTDDDVPATSHLWSPLDIDSDGVQAEYPMNLEIIQGSKQVTLQAAAQGEFLTLGSLETVLSQLSGAVMDILHNPSRAATAYPKGLHSLPVEISQEPSEEETNVRTEFNADESVIREIVSEVAGIPIEKLTLHESIYAYGIDSILAIRAAASCRKRGIRLGVADILQGGHIEGICKRYIALRTKSGCQELSERRELLSPSEKSKALSILNLSEENVEGILPVLGGQLFHLEGWLKCGRTFYEPTWAFKAKERLNVDRFQVSWAALRQRHAILRTVFAAVSSEKAVQVILKASSSVVTGSHGWTFLKASSDATSAVREGVSRLAHAPSDMYIPPVRLCIVRGSDFDAVLFTFHHVVYDAWSMPAMIADLLALYSGVPLTSNPAFPSFVEHTASARSPGEEKEYWTSSLASAESTLLQPRREPNPITPAEQTFVLAPRVAADFASLDTKCKASGVAFSSLVLTAFSRALAKATQTTNPTFGIYQVGRSASFDNLESLAGPCMNLTPLTISSTLSPQAAAGKIQSELGSRVAFEQTPLRDILGYSEGLRFNVFVNLLWHTEKLAEDPKSVLQHMKIGVPTDYCSSEPFQGKTAVDALDVEYLPQNAVYVDIGPNIDTDTVDFGVRCDKVLMDEREVKVFIEDVGREIMTAVESL